jgi:hypothetical protein
MFEKKIVKFDSPEIAQKVEAHLPYVKVEGDRLIFSKFDKPAFELAVALEGLDKTVYSFIENNGKNCQNSPSRGTFLVGAIALKVRRGSTILQIDIEMERRLYYSYSGERNLHEAHYNFVLFAFTNDGQIIQPHSLSELFFVINDQLICFARLVQHETSVTEIISRIERVVLQLNENHTTCTLTITGDTPTQTNQTVRIMFIPSAVNITYNF